MKRLAVLTVVLILCSSTGFAAIQWAGNAVIHLDAMDLATGDVNIWTNKVGVGGDFTNVQGQPSVVEITEGINAVPKKMVLFEAASLDSNVECMRWANAAPASITAGHSFSSEVWLRPNTIQAWQIYLAFSGRSDTTSPVKYAVGHCFGDNPLNASYSVPINYLAPLTLSKFQHIAVTFDSATKDVKLYVNGVLHDTENMPTWNVTTGGPVTIGAWLNGGGTAYYYGLNAGIAEVRVHDGTLTPEQVLANFEEQKDDFVRDSYAEVAQVSPAFNGVGFGDVPVGEVGGPTDFVYTNTGNADLEITNVEIVGSAAFTMNPAVPDLSNLAPDALRTIEITFTPTDGTQQTADLVITSNDANSPVSFPLTGNLDPIYVDQSVVGGDVSGDGSEGNPYQTIVHALDLVGLGGKIIAAPGTYVGFIADSFSNKMVTVTAPEGAEMKAPSGCWLFTGSGEHYLTLDGFTISTDEAMIRGCLAKEGSCVLDLVVRNCTFNYPIGGVNCVGAVGSNTEPNQFVIEDNVFNMSTVTPPESGGAFGAGSISNLEFRNNVVNGGGTSVAFSDTAGASNALIEGSSFLEMTGTGAAIDFQATSGNVTVSKCLISNNANGMNLTNTGLTEVTNCIIDGCGTGITVANNDTNVPLIYHGTFVSSTDSPHVTGVNIANGNADVSNCIVLGFNNAINGTNIGSNNITDGATDNPLFVYQAGGAFARPATRGGNDLHITNGSAAIGEGKPTYVTDDFEGFLRDVSTPDIGAYELEGGIPPTPPPPTTGVDQWLLFE